MPQATPPSAFVLARVHRLEGWRPAASALGHAALRAYYASLRWDITDATRSLLHYSGTPRIIVVWHNRSLIMPAIFRRYMEPERIACLVSASRAGAWETDLFERLGLRVVRGSSTRRSIHALRELIRLNREGCDLGLSPDGPSGPVGRCKPGALMLARQTGAPLLLISANARAAWRPRTWDRHFIPLPGNRITVRAQQLPAFPKSVSDEEAARVIESTLHSLTLDSLTLFKPTPCSSST